MAHQLPVGIVTFLLTDVEGSMRLWHEYGDQSMFTIIKRHEEIIQEAITRNHGLCLKQRGEGDSLFTVFRRPIDAVTAAFEFQQALHAEAWPVQTPLNVRVGIYTGEAQARDNDYFGVTPGRAARLRSVAYGGQTLLCQTTCSLIQEALPEGVTLRDLGTHSIRDWPGAQRIFQLVQAGLPAEFGPLRANRPSNLTQQLTSFIGRGKEIEAARHALGATRLLTLTGPGGTGKTRLALETAERVQNEYKDGVYCVELDALTDTTLIAQTVAGSLGLRPESGQPIMDVLLNYLRSRNVLLIIDNCEHLIRACASFIQILLSACPDLWILATSRELLGLTAETPWNVPPLTLPDAKTPATAEAHLGYEAVRLFVERAQAKDANFHLTDSNTLTVARICRKLDGIPFAIELAAAHVRTLELETLASRLFRVLKSASPISRPHRETLWKTLDWSYNLLDAQEQALLCRLSVFAGRCTLQAVETVCGFGELEADDIYGLLAQLANKSLVGVGQEAASYRLLETVREYAGARLRDKGETENLRERHLQTFLDLAEEAEAKLAGSEQAQWLTRLEEQHDNLRAAMDWTVDGDIRLCLASSLWRFWSMRGHHAEGRACLENALRAAKNNRAVRAKALNGLGVLVWQLGDNAAAAQYLQESLQMCRALNDKRGIAETLNNEGTLLRSLLQRDEALKRFHESLEMCRELRDSRGIAKTLNNIGTVLRDQDHLVEARGYYEESLALYTALQDTSNIAITTVNIGVIAFEQKDYPAARRFFTQALEELERLGNRRASAIIRQNLGGTLLALGEYQDAKENYKISLLLHEELENKSGVMYTLHHLGRIAGRCGDAPRAAVLFGAAEGVLAAFSLTLDPYDQSAFAQEAAPILEQLGEESYKARWTQGSEMPLALAIALATE